MTTTLLRNKMKAIDPLARVSKRGANGWTIRIDSSRHLDAVRQQVADLGLVVLNTDIEGGRFNWSYAIVAVYS